MCPSHRNALFLTTTAIGAIHDIYAALSFTPPVSQYTVLAAFFLVDSNVIIPRIKVISIASGTKCLPLTRLPTRGEGVHDSHAEVLARRGAVRWLLEEIQRSASARSSEWLELWVPDEEGGSGRHRLRTGVSLNMYISTLPCGDASTRFLAETQDSAMAALKDSAVLTSTMAPLPHSLIVESSDAARAARGREGYTRLGVLRTKPGRADAPSTCSMSCSDKIAAWGVLGVQGALGARFLDPVYMDAVIIGDGEATSRNSGGLGSLDLWSECVRALGGRVSCVSGLPLGYSLHPPCVLFTPLPFVHSRAVRRESDAACNEALCWIADRVQHEILINGLRRGVAPKHRFRVKSRPLVSRIAMLQLYTEILPTLSIPSLPPLSTYIQAKRYSVHYQAAKRALTGPGAVFAGWVHTGVEWQQFALGGNDKHVPPIAVP